MLRRNAPDLALLLALPGAALTLMLASTERFWLPAGLCQNSDNEAKSGAISGRGTARVESSGSRAKTRSPAYRAALSEI